MRKRLWVMAAALAMGCAAFGKVWDPPMTLKSFYNQDPNFIPRLEVLKVEFTDSCTTLVAEAQFRSDMTYGLGRDVHLVAEGKNYALLGDEGMTLSDTLTMPDWEPHRFAMRFEPLPADVESFDVVQNRFKLYGVIDSEAVRPKLMSSDWIDERTGDWLIGIYPEGVIYDGRVWEYAGAKPGDGPTAEFRIADGDKELKVKAGKWRDGRRKLSIGGKKFNAARVEGRFLPRYPQPDHRALRDNGYKTGDSITVRGWLRNMPKWLGEQQGRIVTVRGDEVFGQDNGEATLDSLGRFTIRMPIINTAFMLTGWEHIRMRTVLEPEQEYFLMYDFDNGRTLWMGSDARLQNELAAYPPTFASFPKYKHPELDADQYLSRFTEQLDREHAKIDSLCAAEPTLSERFHAVRSMLTDNNFAFDLGQARFECEKKRLTDGMTALGYERFFRNPPRPLTLGYDFYAAFVKDFTDDKTWRSWKAASGDDVNAELLKSDLDEWMKRQWITADSLRRVWEPIIRGQFSEKPLSEERMNELNDSIDKKYGYLFSPLFADPKFMSVMNGTLAYVDMRNELAEVDSMKPTDEVRALWLTQKLTSYIENRNQPLLPQMLAMAREEIKIPSALNRIEAMNNELIALEQTRARRREVSDTLQLEPVDLTGITGGKELLDSILAPLRGRVVLIDVWGTWCGPCREALSHSEELYEALKDSDMAYVYLANSSPHEAWLNVIDKYNVKGRNVIHYNLPTAQQQAIESLLGINSWPSYRIAGPDGRVFNIKVNGRDLHGLENLVKMISPPTNH